MKRKTERGTVMVEATIYFPLVICTVMAMIYYGLFQMQTSALMYEVDRIAMEAAREEAYPGYEVFGMNTDRSLDFAWGGNTPSRDEVNGYFRAHHSNIDDLYREVFGTFRGTAGSESYYEGKYSGAAQAVTLIGAGMIGAPEVEIQKNLISSNVTVTITHRIPLPGVFRYFGVGEDIVVETTRTKSIVNPSEFVRNVDLAVDLTEYLLEKIDPGGNITGFLEKTQDMLQKIL